MANYLKMKKRQQVIALLELGWSCRRIEAETGVRRETVSRYDRYRRSKPAKVFPGSEPMSRAAAAAFHDVITAKLDQRLSIQRIWQNLVAGYGYRHSYESVKRYVRRVGPQRRVAGVCHSALGEEGQVDFFRGAPTLHPGTGPWRRPWVFRLTLCCSHHGYEEAAWNQKLETFLNRRSISSPNTCQATSSLTR